MKTNIITMAQASEEAAADTAAKLSPEPAGQIITMADASEEAAANTAAAYCA